MKNVKGLFTDTQPIDQPENYYRHAENLIINKRIAALANELGQTSVHNLGSENKILGSIYLSDDSIILFVVNSAETDSKIIRLENDSVTVVVDDSGNENLRFRTDSKIEGVSRIDYRGFPVIYWTDNVNPPRTLNLGRIPSTLTYNVFSLFPFIDSMAVLEDTQVNPSGGNLESGAYYFALAYVSEDDVETDYFYISQPVYINDSTNESDPDRFDGAPAGIRTSKSITLQINNIDTDYKFLRVAAIPRSEGVFGDIERFDLTINPEEDSLVYTFTGLRTKVIESLDNIIIPKAFYEKAKTMTSLDNRLYMGNVEGRQDIGYQQYANNITVQAETTSLENAKDPSNQNKETMNSYKNPHIAITKRGYKREEIYAFYISFILNNGSESKAYHIPGRQAEEAYPAETAEGSIAVTQAPSQQYEEMDGDGAIQVDSVPSGIDDPGYTLELLVDGNPVYDLHPLMDTGSIITEEDLKNQIISALNDAFLALNIGAEAYDIEDPSFERVGIKATGSEDLSNTTFLVEGTNPDHTTYLGTNSVFIPNMTSLDTDVDVTVSTGAMNEVINIELDPAHSSVQTASLIASELNSHPVFSNYYTASASSNTITIEANQDGTVYNGVVSVNPKDSGAAFDTNNISGGRDAVMETDLLPSDHKFYSEAHNITSAPKIYQFESISGSNGMGYWENENERYPFSGDDWQGLHGQNVRHHKFPEQRYEPIIGNDGEDYIVLHVSFHNINIPEEIKNKVKGYKIYYAERTPENKTILDQALPFGVTADTEDGVFKYDFYGIKLAPPIDLSTFTFRPFKFLHTQADISRASYIKGFGVPVVNIEEVNTDSDYNEWLITHRRTEYNNEFLSSISATSYLSADTDRVNTSRFGFDYDFDTSNTESSVAVMLADMIQGYEEEYGTAPTKHSYICAMSVFRNNLYQSFDQQTLVWTGFYTEDLEASSTNGVFGGDAFICSYTLRQSSNIGLGGSDAQRALYSTVVESEYNLSWRHSGENFEDKYFPNVSAEDMFNLEEDSPETEPPYYDNFYGYNVDYSALSNIKAVEPFSKRAEDEVVDFPTRIVRSRELNLSESQDNFRVFLQEDYVDMPRERGELVKLGRINNVLLPHFKRGIFRTKGREELQIDDFRAYVGAGDIFSVNPDELIPTKVGFGGIAEIDNAVETEFGYFFVDKQAKKVFLFSQNLEDLSSLKYGMNNFFKDNLKDNSLISAGYDPYFRRLMITDHHNQWTLSYYPENEAWGSFHTYYPTNYFANLNDCYVFYSGVNNRIFKMNSAPPSSERPMVYEFVDNRNPETGKIVASFTMNTEILNGNNPVHNKTFDTIRLYNSHQDTGEIVVENMDNVRKVKNRWNFSDIRHQEDIPPAFQNYSWYFKKRLSDSYTIVRLKYLNSEGFLLYLYDSLVNYREMLR